MMMFYPVAFPPTWGKPISPGDEGQHNVYTNDYQLLLVNIKYQKDCEIYKHFTYIASWLWHQDAQMSQYIV